MTVSQSTLNKSLQVFIVTGLIWFIAVNTLNIDPIKTGVFAGFLFYYTFRSENVKNKLELLYTFTNNKIISK